MKNYAHNFNSKKRPSVHNWLPTNEIPRHLCLMSFDIRKWIDSLPCTRRLGISLLGAYQTPSNDICGIDNKLTYIVWDTRWWYMNIESLWWKFNLDARIQFLGIDIVSKYRVTRISNFVVWIEVCLLWIVFT